MGSMEQFRIKMYLVASELSLVVGEMMKSPNPKEVFKDYMIALYGIIKTTENLLQVAADEAERRFNNGDASCAGLSAYYFKHLKEECEHADWLLADLVSIGASAEEVKNLRPSAEVAALVGSQYYWIYHYHPAAVLGYFAIFESYPMGNPQIDEWRDRTGLPDSAFHTLREHARLDPFHAIELDEVITKITKQCSSEVFDAISTSMVTSCGYVGRVFSSLIEEARVNALAVVPAENEAVCA